MAAPRLKAADYKPGGKSTEAMVRSAVRTTTGDVPMSGCRAIGAKNEAHAVRVINLRMLCANIQPGIQGYPIRPRPVIFLWITLKILLFYFRIRPVDKIRQGKLIQGLQGKGTSMNRQHITERVVSQAYWPRARRQLPKCEACGDSMVAPEASVLGPDGSVYYLWSCDCCGQSLVTSGGT
jgi:hypothetical protein